MRKFIKSMKDEEKKEILENFESFRINGQIGECLLREKAREYCSYKGIEFDALYMNLVATEIAISIAFKTLSICYIGEE